jgi:Asp-tRNA(Asn)/Glu-tRNA(Gln) amidotransferase A subunit family amidase
MPNSFDKKGSPTSISFMGDLYDEATVLAVAMAYQDTTEFHRKQRRWSGKIDRQFYSC